ncbi:histidine phosphatase family protein [Mesorhizobium sp. LHD-90]|uniref:SixA phosphatase family protein n=1 Tax=Mesorhizobium sp. LHD-90 TaxID=3071414 RepID=UPI0027DFCBEF|nr:histidine phosphatase family protein [Mesorhizobium sp. LHD-90]MDQ6434329.1 histidine phosphatase family protein [Mesorhizobium sp. LHD-90]
MKTLLLLRHAKSSWEDAGLADFDRPLAPRGIQAAPRMARELVWRGWLPDAAMVSPALRTRQTWDLVAAELPDPPKPGFAEGIYEASADGLLTEIRKAPKAADTLLVLGHNPALEDFSGLLASADSESGALTRLREKFPTAGLVRFVFAGRWDQLGPGAARLTHFLRPKDFR